MPGMGSPAGYAASKPLAATGLVPMYGQAQGTPYAGARRFLTPEQRATNRLYGQQHHRQVLGMFNQGTGYQMTSGESSAVTPEELERQRAGYYAQ